MADLSCRLKPKVGIRVSEQPWQVRRQAPIAPAASRLVSEDVLRFG